jgi:hypothetical protein
MFVSCDTTDLILVTVRRENRRDNPETRTTLGIGPI